MSSRNRISISRPELEALEPRVLLDSGAEGQAALELFSATPALFAENQGQWADESVRYVHNGSGANVAMTDAGPVFQVFRQVPREGAGAAEEGLAAGAGLPDPLGDRFAPDRYETRVLQFSASFLGANAAAPVGMDPSEARFNYFVGDQANWRSEVPAYEQVAYLGLYEGIDLYAWGQRDSLKYEFHVAPGADWSAIQVRYDGIAGLSLAEDGSLLVDLGDGWGEVADDAPHIYQTIGGETVQVAGSFVLFGELTYGFTVTGAYDPTQELIIDPDLAWATYLGAGGDGYDMGYAIAVDGAGNAYVTGYTASGDLATPGAYDMTYGGQRDAFVAKLNAAGSNLAYLTYLGGGGLDEGRGIAVDAAGNAYVTGFTESTGLATPGAYDMTYGGQRDAFVAKLNAAGSNLAYLTYLGGGGLDEGRGIAVDATGNAYVTGSTESTGLATPGAYDMTYGGQRDAFVAELNAAGSALAYSTYLGGEDSDGAGGIAVDEAGNAYVTGSTRSPGLATPGSCDTTYDGSLHNTDAFVAKLSPGGGTLSYFTYLGGWSSDSGWDIAVDAAGSAYVTGIMCSPGLATPGAYDSTLAGVDAFVAKFSATGSALSYFTYLGGDSLWERGDGIAVDAAGNAYVTGHTESAGLATPGAYDTTYNGESDVFVAKVDPLGSNLLYCTYLGGWDVDEGYGIAVDAAGNAYVTGYTDSGYYLATPGAYDTTRSRWAGDAFVAKVSASGSSLQYATYLGGERGRDRGGSISVDAAGNAYVTGWTESAGWATPGVYDATHNGGEDVFVAKISATGSSLLWATYLGGSSDDIGCGIAVDSSGSVYVTGETESSGWTSGGFDTSFNGYYDAFVAKLTSSGGHVWSTYLGGSSYDWGYGIAVDAAGNAFVTGQTVSVGWATPGAYDTTYNGGTWGDAFVAKVGPTGSSLLWATYLGGSSEDRGYGIAVDSSGNALVTGWTSSSGWVSGGFDTTFGGSDDAFVVKLSPTGGQLWSTYLGGNSIDWGCGIAVDSSGNAFVTGYMSSSDFSGMNNTFKGGCDAFVAKVTSGGSLLWATYLGGSNNDVGSGIAVDAAGNAYVTGSSRSSGWATPGAYDTTYNGGGCDVFVAKVSASGASLLYATYLGGSNDDEGSGIAVDGAGNAYVTGYSRSSGWATPGAYDTTHGGGEDAFVAKITGLGDPYLEGPGYFFSQNDPQWKDDPLGSSGATVSQIGCAMTSVAMVLRSWGVETDPKVLNAWLSAHGGYTAGGSIYWAKAAEYTEGRVQYVGDRSWTGSAADNDRWADLKALLDGGYRVIVKVDGNLSTPALDDHWVLVTGFAGGSVTSPASYAINDPWVYPYEARTLAQYNTFFAMRVFSSGAGTTAGAVDLGSMAAGASLSRLGLVGDGPAGDREADLYRFTLTAEAQVTLDVRAKRDGSTLDAYLRLFDASGREIAANDDTNGQDPYLELDLAAGTYYVGVSGYPNRFYDALRPGTGAAAGSTGFYRLDLAVEAETAPPGEGTPVGALELAGDFRRQTDGTYAATGTIRINDLLRVEGRVWYDSALNIYGSGDVWLDGVSGLENVRIYTGTFGFAAGEVATALLNEALSGFQVVGLDVSVSRFWLDGDAVCLQGHVTLPPEFGNFGVSVSGTDYVRLSLSEGIRFSGATFALPDVNGLQFFGLPFSTSGVRLHVSADEFMVEGTLELPSLLGGTSIAANVKITNDDGGPPEVEVVGALNIDGPIPLGPGFSLEDIVLQVDTGAEEVRGGGTLYLPAGFGLAAGVGLKDGYFDYVTVGATNVNLALLYTPTPPPVPIVYLQDISGELDELAPGPPSLVFRGGMGLTAGPQVHWMGEDYYLLRLNLGAEYDTAGRVSGTGQVLLGGGDSPLEFASAQVVIDKDYGLYVGGDMSLLGILESATRLHLDLGNRLEGSGEGRLTLPAWLGGQELSSSKVAVQYVDDGNDDNDFVMAGWKVGFLSYAAKINLHHPLQNIDWWANYSTLQQFVVPRPPGELKGAEQLEALNAARQGPVTLSAAGPYDFSLPAGLDSAIFRMTWDEGDTDLNLTAPDGTTYTPQNVAGYPNVHYYKDADGKEAVFEVAGPAGGTWQVTVTETAGIGGYRLESRRSTDAAVISLVGPESDAVGGPVTIAWVDEDSDSDAVISLYYDTDRQGADGVLIATGISQDNDPDSYLWDTAGVPTGDYYVYAVIDDGSNVPAISYATGRVRVVDPDGPAALTGLNAPEGTDSAVRLVWDASAAPDLDHYLVRLTSDAAGEFYEQPVAAAQPETVIAGLVTGETYRVTVTAVDTGGHIGQESSPIIVVAGGTATVPPEAGQWDVFAQPGAQYQAQVPGGAGDTFVLVDGPAGATLDGSGLFQWNVPSSGVEGWHQVLVHVTLSDGTKEVRRYCLLTDGTNPTFAAGTVQVAAGSSSSLTITAPAGRDVSGVLQYRLERDGAFAGAWQTSPVFSDSGLQPNTAYSYRVQARESSPTGRTTEWSVAAAGRTLAAVPGAPMFDQVASSTAAVEGIAADGNPPTTKYTILNTTTGMYAAADGTASPTPVWRTATDWTGTVLRDLEPDREYVFGAKARNASGTETELGLASVVRTAREATAPVVSRATANYSTGAMALEFSEAVALSVKDLAVTDSNGSPVDIAAATFSHEAGSTQAMLSFNGTLAEGRYTLKVKGTSVQDLSSNLLDGNGDGQGGDDYSFAFSRLAGDTNGDAKVNIFDLLKVRQNYLMPPGGGRDDNADVTGDGAVNIFDLLMVRQNYLRELPPLGGAGLSAEAPQPLALVAPEPQETGGASAASTPIQMVEVPPPPPIEVKAAPPVSAVSAAISMSSLLRQVAANGIVQAPAAMTIGRSFASSRDDSVGLLETGANLIAETANTRPKSRASRTPALVAAPLRLGAGSRLPARTPLSVGGGG